MAAPSLNESELRFLGALLRRKVRFMVVGLSAAALQGAPVVTQDVDLWFEDLHDPGIAEALREVGAAYVPPSILNPPMFASGGIELFDIVLRMDGLGRFDEEFPNCLDVPLGRCKLKVLRIERILASKRESRQRSFGDSRFGGRRCYEQGGSASRQQTTFTAAPLPLV